MSLHTQDFEYVKTDNASKVVEGSARLGGSVIGNGHSQHGKTDYGLTFVLEKLMFNF